MPKKKVELKVKRIIPNLTPEERARRIENFCDVVAAVFELKGYAGAKYNPETNTVTRYWY